MTILFRIFATALLVLFASTSARGNRIVALPPDTAIIQANATWEKLFSFVSTDFKPPYIWKARSIGPAPVGTFAFKDPSNRLFTFTPSVADTGKLFSFEASIKDGREKRETLRFYAEVDGRIGAVVEIEKEQNTFQGQWEYIAITKTSGNFSASSFNFNICYDGSGLKFQALTLSDTLTKLGWTCKQPEEQIKRIGPLGLHAPTLNIQANSSSLLATELPNGELFTLRLYVTNDRTYECQFIPIQFAWAGIYDNTFMSGYSDTVFSCLRALDVAGRDIPQTWAMANCTYKDFVSLAGPCRNARNGPRAVVDMPRIVLKNGGIDLVCNEIIDAPGDLNLNDIAFEVADFELMGRWLTSGDSVLNENMVYRQAQLDATDVNLDSNFGSVGDLVYLARVIVGDALPFPKLRPYQQAALIEKRDDTLFVEAYDSIGGVLMLFKAGDETGFENLTGIEMTVGRRGSLTTVLLKPAIADLQGHIPPGRTALVRVKGKCEIQDVEVSTYEGSCMNVRK